MDSLAIAAVVLTGAAGLILGAAVRHRAFRKQMQEETRLLAQPGSDSSCFSAGEERLERLPPAVQRWLRLSHSLERAPLSLATISQEGVLRTRPEGRWMPFRAEQHSVIGSPSFIWKAKIRAAPGLSIYGRDLYRNRAADMLIRLMGVFTVGHARGPEIDQGSLVRYLAEIVWYPPAALSSHIVWESVGRDAAKAVITDGSISAEGTFYFQESGLPVRFEAQRYKEAGGTCTLEEWSVRMGAYKKFQGILLPSQVEVGWNLRTGPFQWLRLEVKEARFR
ncbi:DUF6544 family protein [Cohnella hongkongensis]|uniref:DUF6544 family protein n=1 Tax=Cohnella hongkongensis TaxID=178337 RepID=A0ABV9F5Q7_9BACL